MKITTRKEALALGETSFFTGTPCRKGHLAPRGTASGACHKCQSAYMKARRQANPEENKEKCRQWYAKNKDHAKFWKKNWIENNKELYKAVRKQRRMKASTRAKEMLASTRWSARKKHMSHEISLEWISERLDRGICELTGIQFNLEPLDGGRQNPHTASIDRIDCSKGYVMGNVRMIVWALNAAFNTYGEGVYADVARAYLARHNGTGLT